MANDYIEYSAVVNFNSKEQYDWFSNEIKKINQNKCSDINFGNVELRDKSVWFYSDDSGDVELIATLIQKYFQHFTLNDYFVLQYSMSCDKPRPDSFGGGAIFVTAKDIKYFHTTDWIDDCKKVINQ